MLPIKMSASPETLCSHVLWVLVAEDYWKGLHMEICVHYTMSQMPPKTLPCPHN